MIFFPWQGFQVERGICASGSDHAATRVAQEQVRADVLDGRRPLDIAEGGIAANVSDHTIAATAAQRKIAPNLIGSQAADAAQGSISGDRLKRCSADVVQREVAGHRAESHCTAQGLQAGVAGHILDVQAGLTR